MAPLPPGTFTVTVTDAQGCTAVGSGIVGEPPPIVIDLDITHPDCQSGLNGSITASLSGGVPGYSVLWNTGDTTRTISNLTAGTYTLLVTDGNNCMVDTMVVIIGSQLMISVMAEDETCPGANDGSATASATGGTPPYTFTWSNMQSGPTITNLSPGSYTVTVEDSGGCTATATVNIQAGTGINVSAIKTDISCFGANDGTASANASGGSGNYTYSWSNGANTSNITGLSAGTYTVVVTDSDSGCQDSAAVIILEPSQMTCSITVNQQISAPGANDGQLTASGNGGTPGYTFMWSNGANTATISNLGPGTYTVTVTDSNGCQSVCTEELQEPSNIKGKLGDYVWEDIDRDGIQDSNEPGISDVKVTLDGTDINGNTINRMVFTDRFGMYMFGDLDAGTYKLTFASPTNFLPTIQNAGNDDAVDSDINPNTGMTTNYTLMQGDTNLTIDAGFYDICINLTNAGTIGYDEYFCGPGFDPAPIVEIAPPVGGQGNIEYLWMKSNTSSTFSNATFSIIPGATGPTYDPPVIYETTWYVRCTRREFCSDYLETNVVVKEVGDETIAEINGPTTVCINEPFTFEATDAGPGSQYMWDFGPNASPRTPTGRTVTVTYSNFGQRTIHLTVIRPGCTANNILKINISTDPNNCGPNLNVKSNPVNQKDILVEWTAGPETGNITYQILRSKDGKDFRAIMEVPMHGNSFGLNEYEFVDDHANRGYNFYQIMQINRDNGDEFRSNISESVLMDNTQRTIVYPNPSIGFVVERFESVERDGVIKVYDQRGILVLEKDFESGNFSQYIDLYAQSSGLYTIKVHYKGDDSYETFRVVRH
ncbi:MAG: SdrD B-like domain-containing protein [Saprospiraceae bacterium]